MQKNIDRHAVVQTLIGYVTVKLRPYWFKEGLSIE